MKQQRILSNVSMLIDIHTHTFPTDTNTAIYNVALTETENIFSSNVQGYFSVGFHPWYIDTFTEELFEKMKRWTDDKRFIAIGECGLDKNMETGLERQIEVFEKQVELSEEKQKPLIIHCVGRFNELLDLKKQWNPRQPWIIHGFRGKPQLAEQILKAGCDISFGEHFNPESVQITPIKKLFVETDESNMPIDEIYQNIAKVKKCAIEELAAGEKLLKSQI